MIAIETERLRLRSWAASDLGIFHALYADREVMRWVGGGASRDLDHSRRRLDWLIEHERRHGFGLWAIEDRDGRASAFGDCGLVLVEGTGPEIEVAYKLARTAWGCGYATEAARHALAHAFAALGLTEVVGFAFPENTASRRVLEKIGMRAERDEERYGHALARYRITAREWRAAQQPTPADGRDRGNGQASRRS